MVSGIKTALVADSDEALDREIETLFRKHGLRTVSVDTAEKLIERLKGFPVDLILLGTSLTGIKTPELVTVIKSIQPGIPIIVMAGSEGLDLNAEQRIREKGVFYFFVKSFGLDELESAMSKAVTARKVPAPDRESKTRHPRGEKRHC